MKQSYIAAFGLVALLATSLPVAQAEGVAIIEDCESLTGGVGDWGVSGANHISVSLGLNLVGAIDGSKDLDETIGAGLLGSTYTVGNTNLNIAVPSVATHFKFKIRPLLGLNLSRNVTVILTGINSQSATVTYTSPAQSLGLLQLLTTTDLEFPLADFTPDASAGTIQTITGVKLKFDSSVISLAAQERIDSLRVTWDNSGVEDWTCY